MTIGASLFSKIQYQIRILPALKFIWDSSALLTSIRLVLIIFEGSLPLVLLYLLKLVIDQVSLALSTSDAEQFFNPIVLLMVAYGAVSILNKLINVISELVNTAQIQRLTDYMQNMLLEKSIAADLEYYENSDYYDTLQRAQKEAPYRPAQLLNRLVGLGEGSILLVGVIGLLMSLHWMLAGILLVGALPAFFIRIKFSKIFYDWGRRRTALEREAVYLGTMLTSDKYAKEIRLFNLGQWFRLRYRKIRLKIYREILSILSKRSLTTMFSQIFSTIITVSVFVFIAYSTIQGRLQIGDLVLYQQALQRGEGALSEVLEALSGLFEDNLFLINLYEFLDIQPKIHEPQNPVPLNSPPQMGIEFKHVHFQYSNTPRNALRDINLKIEPRQTIALVGENGSGKTTLIKLLCRLYDPTDGEICIDGINIKHYSLRDLRRSMSVIFQDYVQYPFTARENIWLGNSDLDPNDPRIEAAAVQSQADSVIRSLPHGYDTNLGKLFEQGEELSIGQWQKISLARAFARDASIIVLDEPTSAMDPKAEYEIFQQFRELTQSQIAILISHRMSTVKLADFIYVMEAGTIIEAGTHSELMHQNGTYKMLFNAQAQNYQ